MRFAVLSDVLGNDRLLARALAELARRGVSPRATISLGNLVGPHGDSLACVELTDDFAVRLQGPLDRALLHAMNFEADDTVTDHLIQLRVELPVSVREQIRRWPGSVLAPPFAFMDSINAVAALHSAPNRGPFWWRFVPSTISGLLPGEPLEFGAYTGLDAEMIVPRPGEEFDFEVPGGLPVTVLTGSLAGLDALSEPRPPRRLSAWLLDGHFLRYLAFE